MIANSFFAGFFLNIEELKFPLNITGRCQKNLIFNQTLPYWNITGIHFPLKSFSLCKSNVECGEPMDMAPELVSTWDGTSTCLNATFKYFCSMNGSRGLLIEFFKCYDCIFTRSGNFQHT